MKMRVSWPPPLGQFLGGYFNEDWSLDDATWQAVVSRYLVSEPSDSVAAAAAQLKALLATEADDSQLERTVLREHGCCFNPASVGVKMREWLKDVLRMLEGRSGEGAA